MAESIEEADGFAQVFPEHKFHIVDVLQKHGHIVGMTGDGVNDAPALKKADCGIAVSGATDAARAAASIVLVTPGLSVIIDAIKESRKIFQRMNSYAMYRIAETLRVLLFMTLAILIFNFYPLTAIMIVMLALLNDGAILSIAYDNVRYRNQPEAWNMRLVLGIATVLGVVGPIAAFGLFYPGRPRLSPRPSAAPDDDVSDAVRRRASDDLPDPHPRPVLVHPPGADPVRGGARHPGRGDADCGLRRLVMTPLGWKYAGTVWGYAFIWFVVTDPVKLLAYKVLDPNKGQRKVEAKAAPKPDAKSETKAEAKPKTEDEPKPDAKPEAAPEAKAAPQSGAKIEAKPEVELKPDAKADLATLLNTSLGDLLVAGLVKDPEDAGRIIAAADSAQRISRKGASGRSI